MDIEFSKLSINNCDICNDILTNINKKIYVMIVVIK